MEAETGAHWQFSATRAARQREAGSALQAEARGRRVLVLTLGTLHPGPPDSPCGLEGSNGEGRLDRSPLRGQPAFLGSAISGSAIIRAVSGRSYLFVAT